MYVGLSTGDPYRKYVCQNAWAELRATNMHMLKVRLKPTCDTHIIHFDLNDRAALAWIKKKPKIRSLRNEKLKANRASETEEQRKERLRIHEIKIVQEGEQKNYNRERKGRQKQKTMRNSDWPLSKD